VKIRYAGGDIEPADVVRTLVLTGEADALIRGIILRREAARQAAELKIEATDAELQEFADHFRLARSLFSKKETLDYLGRSRMTVQDFATFCEEAVLARKLKDHLAGERAIKEHFIANRSEFELARVSKIRVADQGLAREIVIQVREEGTDFHALADRYSRDADTKHAGGSLGAVPRRFFTPDIAARIFNGTAGDLVGPFPDNGGWILIFIDELIRPELDERIRAEIKERIFREWAAPFVKDAPVIGP
jgi:parvulin-like peptidyl-prolyl isomerase